MVRGCMEGDADPQTFVPRLVEWRRAGAFPVDRIIRTYSFRDIQAAVDDAAGGHVIKPVLVFDPGA